MVKECDFYVEKILTSLTGNVPFVLITFCLDLNMLLDSTADDTYYCQSTKKLVFVQKFPSQLAYCSV